MAETEAVLTAKNTIARANADVAVIDGGCGSHVATDAAGAYRGVNEEDKRKAFILLGAAGVTLAVLFLSRLLWLLKPVYDLVFYGQVSELIYNGVVGVVFAVYVVLLDRFLKRKLSFRLFKVKIDAVDLPRALGVIFLGALAVFVTSAGFGFKLKLQNEWGLGVIMTTGLVNLSVYIYYALHLWLGFIAAALVQYALSTLVPTKFTFAWGAIVLVSVFGLTEFLLESLTTAHMYTWLYYIFTYVYAAIFMLTKRSFHVSYWASLIVLIL